MRGERDTGTETKKKKKKKDFSRMDNNDTACYPKRQYENETERGSQKFR